jgi:hypothetical protein
MYRSYNYYPPCIGFAKAKAPRKEGHIKKSDTWLTGKYNTFNKWYWKGQLPKLPVYFRGHQNAGQVGAAYGWAGHAQGITINGYMSQDNVLNVLLHEMVHIEQFILRNQNGDHGRYFKSRCRELTALTNKRYGVVK